MPDPDPQEPTPTDPPSDPPGNPDPTDPPADPTDPPLGEAGEKALEAWKARAREAEKAAKAHEAELEQLRNAAMTEQERAVAEAESRGRLEATSAVGQRLAAAEIKAALTGVVPDPAAIVEDLNLAKYVGDDGEVDTDAVEALKAKYAGFATTKAPVPGVPAGARPDGSPRQLTRADLKTMTAAEIDAATDAGQLDELLGRK